jgi:hypothetical protein
MRKQRGTRRRRGRSVTTSPWRDSVDPTNPDHRPRGHTDSLHLALDLLNLEQGEREAASQEICAIAERYNSVAAVAISAPRFKAVEARLLALRDAYAELSQQLNALDSATLNQIHDPRARGDQRLYRLAGAGWLQEPHIRPSIQDGDLTFESPLIRAKAMKKYLGRVIEVFRKKRKTDRGAIDRGGNENVFRLMRGHEKLHLARECADLFDKYGLGGRITKTETGPFFQFVSHVHDFAVGEASAGDSRGLADPIKQAARGYKELMSEADQLKVLSRRSR